MTLDAYLSDAKITDQALAAKIGVSRPHVTKIRHGKRRPSPEVAAKIEAETGIPAMKLLLGDEWTAPKKASSGKARKGRSQ